MKATKNNNTKGMKKIHTAPTGNEKTAPANVKIEITSSLTTVFELVAERVLIAVYDSEEVTTDRWDDDWAGVPGIRTLARMQVEELFAENPYLQFLLWGFIKIEDVRAESSNMEDLIFDLILSVVKGAWESEDS